jgi:hypothetical protein
MGSKQRPPIKKETTLKYKGLKRKTIDEKRGDTLNQKAKNH